MTVLLKNNVSSTLATAIAPSDTGLVVADGSRFPTITAGDYFYVTLVSQAGQTEIVKVTARVGNSMTVARAQDGSSAASFQVGTLVDMRVNVASIAELRDEAGEITIADAGGYYTSGTVEGALQETGAVLQDSVSRANVAVLLTDTTLTYTAGQPSTVTTGDIVRTRAEGFAYTVAASGATNHHVATTGGVKLYVMPSEGNTLPLKAFAPTGAVSLVTAITAADAAGIYLDWQDAQVSVTSAVSVTVAQVLWKSNGAKITYTGSSDIDIALLVNLGDGVDHKVVGSGLEVDGSGKATMGIRFLQPLGTDTTTLYAERLVSRNIEKQIGGNPAAGIEVRGGFGNVTLIEPEVHRMMIRTGAGVPGSSGIIGIWIQNQPSVAGAYCRNIEIIRPKIRRVYSQDPAYLYDMDGIGLFANPDVVGGSSYAKIVEPDCRGCWGRDIKSQFARCDIMNPRSVVDEGPTPTKSFPNFDFQSGPGLLLGGSIVIDGVAATGIVRYGTSTAVGPCSHVTEGGVVSIVNGGSLLQFATQDAVPAVKMVTRTKGVSINGSVREFAYIRTNGLNIDYCFVEGVTATLTDVLFRVESSGGGVAPYISNVFANNCVNLGSPVPVVRMNIGGQAAQAILSQENLFGFVDPDRTQRLNAATLTGGLIQGVRRPEAGNPSADTAVGGERFLGVTLLDGTEFLLPEWGFESSCVVEIKASTDDRNGYAILCFDTGGFTTISVGSNFSIGGTSDPGVGSYRVWRVGSRIMLKNAQGNTRRFTISMRG